MASNAVRVQRGPWRMKSCVRRNLHRTTQAADIAGELVKKSGITRKKLGEEGYSPCGSHETERQEQTRTVQPSRECSQWHVFSNQAQLSLYNGIDSRNPLVKSVPS